MDTNDLHYWVLWDVVNILAPIVLTPLAMLIVCAGRSADPRYAENGHVMTVIKDGQMGFVTVPMAAAMVMEMLGRTLTVDMAFAVLGLAGCAIGGAFVAALGAVYTADRKSAPAGILKQLRYYAFMWLSLLFVTGASVVTHYARWHLLK